MKEMDVWHGCNEAGRPNPIPPSLHPLITASPHPFITASLNGFTLVELLVTVSLMTLVGAAAVGALSGGVRVWERVAMFGTGQQEALVACEWLRRDVQNARRFAPIAYKGEYDQCSFPAADRDPVTASGPKQIGQLGFFHDQRRRRLCRSFVPYRLMGGQRLRDQCQSMLDGVTRARFSFFGVEESGQAEWSGDWSVKERGPWALKAELTLERPLHKATTYTCLATLSTQFPRTNDEKKLYSVMK